MAEHEQDDRLLPPHLLREDLGGGREMRLARPEEYAEVGRVLQQAFSTGCWVTPWYHEHLAEIAQRAQSSHVWVVVDAEGVLGVVLTPRPDAHTGASYTFNILGVHPRGRGLNLGWKLVDHAVTLAAAAGYRDIEIHSSPQMTAAHQLYVRYGFVRRPERETGVVDSGQRLHVFTYRIPPQPSSRTRPPAPRHLQEEPVNIADHRPAGTVDSAGQFVAAEPGLPGPVQPVSAVHYQIVADVESLRSRAALAAIDLLGLSGNVPVHPGPDPIPALYDAGGDLVSDDWRWLSRAVAQLDDSRLLYPERLRAPIDRQISQIHEDLYAGVERALFSDDDEARLSAIRLLYARLGQLEWHLTHHSHLVGNEVTVADLELVGFLIGLDLEYRAHLGFWAAAVADYPHLFAYARRLVGEGALTSEQLIAIGALPFSGQLHKEPYGSPREVEGIADLRVAWTDRLGAAVKELVA